MTDGQICQAIRSGRPFFGITSRGEVLARYVQLGPVFRWEGNSMTPAALEGDDLLWWLQAGDEDDHPR